MIRDAKISNQSSLSKGAIIHNQHTPKDSPMSFQGAGGILFQATLKEKNLTPGLRKVIPIAFSFLVGPP